MSCVVRWMAMPRPTTLTRTAPIEDGQLADVAGHAVDERPDPPAPLDALERPVPRWPAPGSSRRSAGTGGARARWRRRARRRARRRRRPRPTPRAARWRRPRKRPGAEHQGDGEPAEDDDDARHVGGELARRRSQLDLAEAAHLERVQLPSVLARHRDLTERRDGEHFVHGVGLGRMVAVAGAVRRAGHRGPRDEVPVGAEVGVDAPRREVAVDPLPRFLRVRHGQAGRHVIALLSRPLRHRPPPDSLAHRREAPA